MNHGCLEQVDISAAIYERPRTRFVAEFLGSCNLLHATVRSVNGEACEVETELGCWSVPVANQALQPRPGQRVLAGFRPEKVGLNGTARGNGGPRFGAVVAEIVYSGSETQYWLNAGGQRLKAVSLNTHSLANGVSVGHRVECSVGATNLILLEDA
jgi:spermidine/putrescine transport system ATP-binding protein